jgi:hypothetical protein
MIKSGLLNLTTLYLLIVALYACSLPTANARQSHHFGDGFRAGASLNYGGIYFERDGFGLNDIWLYSTGYQFHMDYGIYISSILSLRPGIELFVHRYELDELTSPETNPLGEPTGSIFRSSMDGPVGTTYLSLPVFLIIRPFGNKSVFAVAGPDISFKIAHKNGVLTTIRESGEQANGEVFFVDAYDIPERSAGTILSLNAGIGYSLDARLLPLDIEIRAKHSVTPYMGGDDFIDRWIRSLSFSVSYRL